MLLETIYAPLPVNQAGFGTFLFTTSTTFRPFTTSSGLKPAESQSKPLIVRKNFVETWIWEDFENGIW